MVQYKKQLDAVMRCLTAETEEDRKNAQQEIRELLDGAERTAGKQDAESRLPECESVGAANEIRSRLL